MSRKTALELERLLRLRLAGERWAASRTALPAAEETLRAGSLPLERAAGLDLGEAGRAGSLREAPSMAERASAESAAVRSTASVPANEVGSAQTERAEAGLALAGEAGRAGNLREAPAMVKMASAESAAAQNPAWNSAVQASIAQSAASALANEVGSAQAERAEAGLSLAEGSGRAESQREAPAMAGITLAESAAAGLALAEGPGRAGSRREAPAMTGRALAESAATQNPAAQNMSAQSQAIQASIAQITAPALLREPSGASANRAADLTLAKGRGATLPGAGSFAAQAGEEALRLAAPDAGSAPALADSPERSVRLLAALPENGLPDSGEARLFSLPRPAGAREKSDGAGRSAESRPAARSAQAGSGGGDFWELWARRFAGELHSSAEGVHG